MAVHPALLKKRAREAHRARGLHGGRVCGVPREYRASYNPIQSSGGQVKRRSFLAGLATLALPVPEPLLASSIKSEEAFRRVRPSDPQWPTVDQWHELSRAVSGRLTQPKALLASCEASGQSEDCHATLANLRNPFYLGDQAAGTQVSGWLNAWSPVPSAYVVSAENELDVAAAVRFAALNKLRLAVKGGGHSYHGTSTAPDSLLIWTRRMRGIELHDAFVGAECAGVQPPAPAVSVDAGAMWIDVYDAVTTRAGRYVQGGGCTTVGVAGLVQSGGFGSFSKGFGTAASHLLEARVVTADGSIRTANPSMNPDLFWALKGGGGGTFGAVTRLTLRTHALPQFFGAANAKIKASSKEAFKRLIDRFLEFYASNLLNAHWGDRVSIQPDNVLDVSMVAQGLDADRIASIWKPFFSVVAAPESQCSFAEEPFTGAVEARGWWDAEARRKRGSTSMIADSRAEAPASHAWWAGDQEQVSAFLHGYDSVWLPAALLKQHSRARLTQALFASSRELPVGLHFNKGLAGAPEHFRAAALDTATNPEVVDAFALAIVATGGTPPYPGLPTPDWEAAKRGAHAVSVAAGELRKLAPSAGSYVSESNYFNSSWQVAFWGRNYRRLRVIKKQCDPTGLFFVRHGVGTEDWSDDGFERRG